MINKILKWSEYFFRRMYGLCYKRKCLWLQPAQHKTSWTLKIPFTSELNHFNPHLPPPTQMQNLTTPMPRIWFWILTPLLQNIPFVNTELFWGLETSYFLDGPTSLSQWYKILIVQSVPLYLKWLLVHTS